MKKYEELTFADDFMFCKVLTTNPNLCRELLELIIGRKVGQFTRLDQQQPIELTADGKEVRFDVYSEDESTKIFLCAGGGADDVSPDMKDFLDWLSGKQGRSRLVGELENAVQKVKDHKEWRTEYMTLLMRDQEMMRKGIVQGTMTTLFSLVQDGILTLDEAASRVSMLPEEFKEAMEKSANM